MPLDLPQMWKAQRFVNACAQALARARRGQAVWRRTALGGIGAGLLCVTLSAWAQPGQTGARWSGVVSWVSDGDTVWVQGRDGVSHKVRLLGIDAPEICQPHGWAAKSALEARIGGQTVWVQGQHHDTYGRLLARLQLHGSGHPADPVAQGAPKDVGRWMVQQGHAWSYRFGHDAGPYAADERHARHLGLGLFADPSALHPRDFRRSQGGCHEAGSPAH